MFLRMNDGTPPPETSGLASLRQRLRVLYLGREKKAITFQAVLAVVDLAILAFFVLGPDRGRGYVSRLANTEVLFFLPAPGRKWTVRKVKS